MNVKCYFGGCYFSGKRKYKPPVFTRGFSALSSGAEGSRTPGLLNAIQALSQLSYSPNLIRGPLDSAGGAEGIRTPGLISAIDALSQLSYSPATVGYSITR